MFRFNQSSETSVSKAQDEKFHYQDQSHLAIINDSINRFNQAQKLLMTTDNNIINGLLAGSICWVGSYILPTVTLSIGGFCFATYHWAERKANFKAYKDALNHLISIYQWSMGKETGNHWYKLATKEIQQLITALGPWVSNKTIHTWDANALKPSRLESYSSSKRRDFSEEFENKLNQFSAGQQMVGWQYRLYSENGIEDIVGFIQSYINNAVSEAIPSITRLFESNDTRKAAEKTF